MNELKKRTELLRRLAVFDEPMQPLLEELRQFGWDCDNELIFLSESHIISVLDRFIEEEITASDIQAWTECFEMREDVGFESEREHDLNQIIFRLATPEITYAITKDYAIKRKGSLELPAANNRLEATVKAAPQP